MNKKVHSNSTQLEESKADWPGQLLVKLTLAFFLSYVFDEVKLRAYREMKNSSNLEKSR